MNTVQRINLYNILSIVCGIWFALTSWVWLYYANLFLSLPIGLVGLFFWNKSRQLDPGNLANRIALILYIVGFVLGLGALLFLLLYN